MKPSSHGHVNIGRQKVCGKVEKVVENVGGRWVVGVLRVLTSDIGTAHLSNRGLWVLMVEVQQGVIAARRGGT